MPKKRAAAASSAAAPAEGSGKRARSTASASAEGASTAEGGATTAPTSRHQYASICSSNMNRSMECHFRLRKRQYAVRSYGTGTQVKLPGRAADKPNVYDFGTPYEQILAELSTDNADGLYTANGVMELLARNVGVKRAPERWQLVAPAAFNFDVVLTFEERVYDLVFEDFTARELRREMQADRPVHCINIDVKDSHEEALRAAAETVQLCETLETIDLSDTSAVESAVDEFKERTGRAVIYTLFWR